MKKLITLAALSAIAALAGMAGCSDSGSDVIARVDDKELTADDFELYAGNMRIAFPSAEEEFAKKREILDSMVVMELLIRAAYEKNIDKSEEVARVILANRPRFLLDALYGKEVVEKTDVTDPEISLFYDRLEFKMRAFQVLVNDEDTAQMVFERLKEGADIEQMAFEYSVDPSAKRNRGDVGYFVWGAMVDEFQEACLAMEVGELSPPVKSIFGYHIIKLVDKAPNEARTSFEEMKESIRRQILNRKRSTLTQEYFTMIREKYPIVIDPAPCEYVLHKREGLYPPQLLKNLPRSDFDLEQLDRDERELVLATWEGGQVSIGEYLTLIQNVPVQYRPDLDDYDSLEVIVFELKKQDILVYEAIVTGIESDEAFQKKLARFKDLAMAEVMRNDSIQMPPLPSEQEARQYYDDRPAEFSNPAKVHIYEILLSDEMQARRLAGDIRSLEEFKSQAMDLTERPGKRRLNGDLGFIERDWFPEIFDVAWKTSIGGIGGPIPTGGKYSIFYVVDRTEAELKDFLPVKRQIVQQLSSQKAIETFTEWVEQRKAASDITIYEDQLWELVDRSQYVAADSAQPATD